MPRQFENPTITKLYKLYQEHKSKELPGYFNEVWKIIGPSIPDMLLILDMEPEMYKSAKQFIIKLAEVMQEDGT